MKLAINGATTMTSDLPTDIAAASAAGFRYLEIWAAKMDRYLKDHTVEDLANLFAKAGVRPVSINSIEFITFHSSDYEKVRARCEELSSIAQRLSCQSIVVVPSPTPDRETSWAEIEAESVRVLRDLGAIAARFGVSLAFEPLGFGWCSVRTAWAGQSIVRKVGLANVGQVLDACHFYGAGSQMEEIDRLDPKSIFIFHLDDVEDVPKEAITDAQRLMPGTGILPLTELCRRLKAIGFDGLASVELFRPEYWSWPAEEVARTSRRTALAVLSPHWPDIE